MHRIERIQDVNNLHTVASQLMELIHAPANADIQYMLPPTHPLLTGDATVTVDYLALASNNCSPGIYQQWVAFAGEQAVGMSVVGLTNELPEIIPVDYPDVSLFVCYPYRRMKIGTQAMQQCVEEVNRNYNGKARACVNNRNNAYKQLVSAAGFRPFCDLELATVYTYNLRDHTRSNR